MTLRDLVLSAHILLAGGWIGADSGVMLTTRRMLRPGTPAELRIELSRIADLLDMGARSALVLMLGLGLLLTSEGGFALTGVQGRFAAEVGALLCLVWLAGLWHQWWVGSLHLEAGAHPRHMAFQRAFRRVDLGWRVVLVVVLLGVAAGALGVRQPALPAWLAVKLALFAVIVALGISIRLLLPRLARALAVIAALGSSPGREAAVARAAAPLYAVVWAIWALVAVVIVISVVRPG